MFTSSGCTDIRIIIFECEKNTHFYELIIISYLHYGTVVNQTLPSFYVRSFEIMLKVFVRELSLCHILKCYNVISLQPNVVVFEFC